MSVTLRKGGDNCQGSLTAPFGCCLIRRILAISSQSRACPLYVLSPKRPQYNGGVERMTRTMRDDLYARKELLFESLTGFREAVKNATHTYNHYRPHQALDNLTPGQYVAASQVGN